MPHFHKLFFRVNVFLRCHVPIKYANGMFWVSKEHYCHILSSRFTSRVLCWAVWWKNLTCTGIWIFYVPIIYYCLCSMFFIWEYLGFFSLANVVQLIICCIVSINIAYWLCLSLYQVFLFLLFIQCKVVIKYVIN